MLKVEMIIGDESEAPEVGVFSLFDDHLVVKVTILELGNGGKTNFHDAKPL